MFRLFINDTDHGTFEEVSSALDYVRGEIESGDLETIDAGSLSISIVK